MHQCGGGDALLLEGGQQVGQEIFHAAGEGRIKLADVEDAHTSHLCPSSARGEG